MERILITYASHSGSTGEIASFLGREFSAEGQPVDVVPLSQVADLSPYGAIIAGGLLYRFGWHPEIIAFLEKKGPVLQKKKVALFVTGMQLVKTPDCDHAPYPVFIDPSILPQGTQKKNMFASYTTLKGYLNRVLPTLEAIKPVSLGFFAGKVDLDTLKLPEKIILKLLLLLTHKQPGDYRNWDSIRSWAHGLGLVEEKAAWRTYESIAHLQ